LGVDNAWLNHIKINLPEHLLLAGRHVEIRGQSSGQILKLKSLLMGMSRLQPSVALIPGKADLD
jgi:hypothetical protein